MLEPDIDCFKATSFFQVRTLSPALDVGSYQHCNTTSGAFVRRVRDPPIHLKPLPVHVIRRFPSFGRTQVGLLDQQDVVFGCLCPVGDFLAPHCNIRNRTDTTSGLRCWCLALTSLMACKTTLGPAKASPEAWLSICWMVQPSRLLLSSATAESSANLRRKRSWLSGIAPHLL